MNTATERPAEVAQLPAAQTRQRLERIVVESAIPVLDTAMFDHMTRIATIMASSGLVPAHLNIGMDKGEAIANCFLVTNQAVRWKMDPFAVAQHTYVLKGKLGYEGKLVAAVINTRPEIIKRLSYRFEGEKGKGNRKVIVSARIAGDDVDKEVEGTVDGWKTNNDQWKGDADQQLTYRGAREWARRHLPEAILGVWGDDELEQFETTGRTVQGEVQTQQPQPTRGVAGLNAALKNSTATDVADATVDDKASTPAKAAKPAGTLEQRDQYVKKFGDCKDAEILALVRDEANGYAWTDADREVLDAEYSKHQDRLAGGKG
jgi:hypothetical protein